jgi:hypothetical protein
MLVCSSNPTVSKRGQDTQSVSSHRFLLPFPAEITYFIQAFHGRVVRGPHGGHRSPWMDSLPAGLLSVKGQPEAKSLAVDNR